MRRRVPWGLLAVLFVVVPLVEIALLVEVGQRIGLGWTLLLLVADSVLGAVLLKREGRQAWAALVAALRSGRVPARELADGILILVGGTLLLTPGFFTDVLGFLFIVPVTRPLARRALTAFLTRRFLGTPHTTRHEGSDPKRPRPGPTVRGEVVD